MRDYYVFDDEAEAIACLDFINTSAWFPITGTYRGLPATKKQRQTTTWVRELTVMANGNWAIPRIPESKLDAIGVSQAERDLFMSYFGDSIQTLDYTAFPPAEETEEL